MLEDFGLSSYESRVFEALVKSGTMSAKQICKVSGVPYGRIYEVLNNLDGRGLLVKSGTRPQKFHSVEPSIAIDLLKESKVKELDQLFSKAELYKEKLERMRREEPGEEFLWRLGIGESNLPVYFSAIQETHNEYLGYVEVHEDSHYDLKSMLDTYSTILKTLVDDGIRVRMLIGVDNPNILIKLAQRYPRALDLVNISTVRIITPLLYPFSIIDDKKSLIKIKNPVDPSEDLATLYVQQKALTRNLRSKFISMWNEAVPISDLLSSNQLSE